MSRTIAVCALVCLAGWVRPLAAQEKPPAAEPRTITGVVQDTMHLPIRSALVSVPALDRSTRTADDGTFRFDDVPPGDYDVNVQRIGFRPRLERVEVGPQGGYLRSVMVPTAYRLEPIVTVSTRGGISGVVADTAFKPVPNAKVALDLGRNTRTDSLGRFFLPAKTGSHLLRITHDDFASALVSVSVPRDSGRTVMFWLHASNGSSAAREAFIMDKLRRRLLLRTGFNSRVFTHEDMLRIGFTELEQIARAGAVTPIDGSCEAIVDDTWHVPLASVSAQGLEFVEVYANGRTYDPFGWKPRASQGSFSMGPRPQTRVSIGCPIVYAWTRR